MGPEPTADICGVRSRPPCLEEFGNGCQRRACADRIANPTTGVRERGLKVRGRLDDHYYLHIPQEVGRATAVIVVLAIGVPVLGVLVVAFTHPRDPWFFTYKFKLR